MTRHSAKDSPDLFIRAIRVVTLSLMCFSLAGFCLKAEEQFTEWNVRRTAFGLIKVIQHQQKAHYRECRSYASSFRALGVFIPEELTAKLLSGRMDRHPTYMVELCSADQCWVSDQSGAILSRDNSAVEADDASASPDSHKAGGAEKIADDKVPDNGGAQDNLLPAQWVPKPLVASTQKEVRQELPKKAAAKAKVIPTSSPESFGLPPGTEIPPLSPRYDSDALWGRIEEVHP